MKKSSSKRDLIQRHAVRLFREDGYESVSIARICQEAGVAEGTFYYHFPTKDALIRTLVMDPFALGEAVVTEILDCDTSFERLLAMIFTSTNYALELGPDIMRAYFRLTLTKNAQGTIGPREHMKKPFDRFKDAMIRTIGKAQQAGEVYNMSAPVQLARLIDRIVIGSYLNWCFMDGSYNLKKALREKFEVLLDAREDLRTETTRG